MKRKNNYIGRWQASGGRVFGYVDFKNLRLGRKKLRQFCKEEALKYGAIEWSISITDGWTQYPITSGWVQNKNQ